jgi:hypothetical protein
METKTIHAFTEPVSNFPAFINVATRGEDAFFITARGRGTNSFVRVQMTRNQIEALAADIFNHFNRAY